MRCIGITERGDAALDLSWKDWVKYENKAILITKDFYKLYTYLKNEIIAGWFNPKNIIVHATVTGMAGSLMEPNVPQCLWDVINTAKTELELADLILRVDPVIPTEEGIKLALGVINSWTPNWENPRVRISFIDNYYHIRDRGVELPWNTLHAPMNLRMSAYNKIREVCEHKGFQLEICGEPGFDCTGCVSTRDLEAFSVLGDPEYDSKSVGYQRNACACLAIKRELLNNRHPCAHGCLYCYWKD